jgi:uncharacterized repeat protein (TIGR01451 family)
LSARGRALLQREGTLLNGATPISSGQNGPRTVGVAFTPGADLVVTHVRHCFGTHVSLWSEGGLLLVRQAVSHIAGQWEETPLEKPVTLRGGQRYRLGVTTGADSIFLVTNTVPFEFGTIHHGCFWVGDAYPLSAEGEVMYAIDLKFLGTSGGPLPLTPTAAGPFNHGVWSGTVVISEAAEDVVLTADDGAGHTGFSLPLQVLPASDVSLVMGVSGNPVLLGRSVQFNFEIHNSGPGHASGVIVSNPLPAALSFVSAVSSHGTVRHEFGTVIVELGALPGGATASVQLTVLPTASGMLTNHAWVDWEGEDSHLANNSAEAIAAVVEGGSIVLQPQDQTILAGGTATFRVQAFGPAPLEYQWLFDEIAIPGATNGALRIQNVQPSHAGQYKALIGTAGSTFTSAPARLTVLSNPSHPGGNPVYTVNVLGYINLSVPPGDSMLGRSLFLQPESSVANLFGSVPDGVTLFKPDGNGFVANPYLDGWADPEMPVLPGEGFILRNPYETNLTVTIVGEVGLGSLIHHLPAGPALVNSIVPQAGRLVQTLQFPAASNDLILMLDPATGGSRAYTFRNQEWFPEEPMLEVGQSFWSIKETSADWERFFVLNLFASTPYRVAPNPVGSHIGQVNFFTWHRDPAKGRVLDADGVTPLTSTFSGQFYAGLAAAETAFFPVGEAVRFLNGEHAGYLRAGTVSIPTTPGNQRVFLQLRVWEHASGTSYEEAAVNGGRVGRSTLFAVTTGSGLLGTLPGMLPPTANEFPSFSVGPAGTAPHEPPLLLPVAHQWIYSGSTLVITNAAADLNGHSAQMRFSLAAAPSGAAIDPETGVFNWTPSHLHEPGTYSVTVRVSDGGASSRGVSQSFLITVLPRPELTVLAADAGEVVLTWPAYSGQRYRVQFKDDLSAPEWLDLAEEIIPSGNTGEARDRAPVPFQRFYRLMWLP